MPSQRHEFVQPIVVCVDKERPAPALDAIRAVADASVKMYARDMVGYDSLDETERLAVRHIARAWSSWLNGPIAKTVRRADRATYERLVGSTSLTEATIVTRGDAEAIAFRPMMADELPNNLRRLQVSGTQLPEGTPTKVLTPTASILLNADLDMSTGKAAAQAAHALFTWFLNTDESPEPDAIECDVSFVSGKELEDIVASRGVRDAIHDAGRTEIEPGSLTAIAVTD
ncbi:peptidyl-tRNA hydrolase [Frigoribacterium sp. SL97]|uniref:peptidyl-tRNA hydrolase n=1 Tax=Frigoribacterium sp. SL97 TaxID=2994664 RepID=UPI0022702332|nr:peptidyl-tRNA hydrolase [Frigoribacterium sp. SL97]WAC50426.1 hypothetical protein OVA02_11145 [Frigoribacterium sp. SL97]